MDIVRRGHRPAPQPSRTSHEDTCCLITNLDHGPWMHQSFSGGQHDRYRNSASEYAAARDVYRSPARPPAHALKPLPRKNPVIRYRGALAPAKDVRDIVDREAVNPLHGLSAAGASASDTHDQAAGSSAPLARRTIGPQRSFLARRSHWNFVAWRFLSLPKALSWPPALPKEVRWPNLQETR